MNTNKLKIVAPVLIMLFATVQVNAQKYFSRTGEISFYSKSIIENIEATSSSASTVFDSKSGQMQWAVLIKSFEFEKALMQEHFNENYMESSKFTKAKFSGEITNIDEIDFTKDGDHKAILTGKIEIHGVTKEIEAEAIFQVADAKVKGKCVFKVKVADFDIKIPGVVKDNIAKEIEIKINANYELLDKS